MERQVSLLGEYVYLYYSVGNKIKVEWKLFEERIHDPICQAIYRFPESNSCSEIKDFTAYQIVGQNWERIK